MGFREWLYNQLVTDGVINEEDTDLDELTEEYLTTTTELYDDDIQSYRNDYNEYCANIGQDAIDDLPED